MRLKHVYISQYKNLKDFKLDFDGTSFLDVFVGKNGTGKSNFFEALIIIFQHIAEYDRDKDNLDFSYRLEYEINGESNNIEWSLGEIEDKKPKRTDRRFLINGKDRKTIGATPLPDNVLVYYSGHNDTVTSLVERYEATFRKRIIRADNKETRYFIGIGPDYKELLLSALLMQADNCKARQFIFRKLGIEHLGLAKPGSSELTEPIVRIIFERPNYAKGSNKAVYDIVNNDAHDRYWKPEGIAKEFLDRLTGCVTKSPGGLTVTEGYLSSEDRYVQYLDISKVQQEFVDLTAQELFRQFDNLKTLGMLKYMSIPLRLDNGVDANIDNFSDGQFQSVYIYAIIELFKDRNCITLLDEPDSFLHPEWQFEFLKQVFDVADAAAGKNHVLMSSHSASTIATLDEKFINLFKIDQSSAVVTKASKAAMMHALSGGMLQYSECQSMLRIDNVVRLSSKPILFVEGPSDVLILETAFKKLYGEGDLPVLIQDAFDRGYLRVLMSRSELYNKYPSKIFFALFDFDDAYDDWRSMSGEHVITDVSRGLCKKLIDKNAYAFLLPVPSNELKDQVWDEQNPVEKVKSSPCFGIEHIFWPDLSTKRYFREQNVGDQKKIIFKGDKHKIHFAETVVPTMTADVFAPFRPMFEFIKGKC